MLAFLRRRATFIAGGAFAIVLTTALSTAYADWRAARVLAQASVGSSGPARDRIASGSATALDSPFWTDWQDVASFCKVHVLADFVDANDSVTNYVMRCEESESSDDADDAGHDIPCRSISGGVETYTAPCEKKVSYSNGSTNTGSIAWTIENLHGTHLNCRFSAEGAPAAADTAAWSMLGEHCK